MRCYDEKFRFYTACTPVKVACLVHIWHVSIYDGVVEHVGRLVGRREGQNEVRRKTFKEGNMRTIKALSPLINPLFIELQGQVSGQREENWVGRRLVPKVL